MKNFIFLLLSLVCVIQISRSQIGPGCPNIEAGNDTIICKGSCITLTSIPFHTGATNTYTVSEISYTPFPYTGTPVLVNSDDVWSGIINLPFNFCFFGSSYNKVVIGANGLISFNTSYANAFCPWSFNVPIPNATLPLNTIMGPYHDIDPSKGGNIYYQIYGTSPCRVFVVSYVDIPMFSTSCNNMKAKHQIAIYENTNVIEIYIEKKPVCSTWNGGRSIVGIQNSNGTTAFYPPGENISTSPVNNKAWRFTPNGTANYSTSWWQGGVQIAVGNTVNVCPTTTTTYTAKIVYTNCDNTQVTITDDKVVTVNNYPTPTISGNTNICSGESTNLTVTGGTTYMWSNGSTNSTITVSPTTTTTYTVTAANGPCTATQSVTINVTPLPTLTISGNTSICSGESTTLTANGATTYLWNTGNTSASINISPSSTTTYTVTGYNGSCYSTATKTVSVTPLPNITISGNTSICSGNSTTLTASGGTTYNWSNGENTPSITVFPTITTTYTVTAANGNCYATNSVTVNVTQTPTVTITGNNSICSGETITISASGATSYLWSNGSTNNSINVSPTTTTTYTVTGYNGSCYSTATKTVNVISTPNPTISGNTSICSGQSTILIASGGTTYIWNTGATTISITVSPTSTTSYSVTAANGSCFSTTSITVTVTPTPTVTISGNTSICSGQSATLTASGASNYSWNTGANTASINVSPTSNTTYTVTGYNGSCYNTATHTLNVVPSPSPSISGNTSICVGESTTLTVSGGTSYIWSNGSNNSSIVVSPTSTTTYTVTAYNGSCYNTTSATVTVVSNPTISISGNTSICIGNSTSLTASGATTYTWSNGSTNATTIVSPTVTTSYTVTGTIGNCSATNSVTVNVFPLPTINISGNTSICSGQNTTLTATGANSYVWNTGSTNNSITISPTTTTTYTVTGTSINGCLNTASQTVNVTQSPSPIITGNTTICSGGSTTLTAQGGTSYVWSTGSTNASITVAPIVNTTYTVTAINNNCTGTASATVQVLPSLNVTISGTSPICSGSSVILSANGASSYVWSTGATTQNITVSPTTTATYSVTGTSGQCSGTASYQVQVYQSPTATLSGNTTICSGQSATLTVNLTGTPPWSLIYTDGSLQFNLNNINTTPYTFQVFPSSNTTYSLISVSDNHCTSGTVSGTATVNVLQPIQISNLQETCNGGNTHYRVTFTISGGDPSTYVVTGVVGNLSNTPPYTFTSNMIPSGTPYNITVTDAYNCSPVTLSGVQTCTCPASASLSGTTSICQGQSATLTLNLNGQQPWTVVYLEGSTPRTITNITTSPYHFTVTPNTTTVYTLQYVQDKNCVGNVFGSATVTVNNLPTATIGGSTTVCQGNPALLQFNLTGTPPWTVTFTDGTNDYTASFNNTPATYPVIPTTTSTYTITNVNDAKCNGTFSGSAVITVNTNISVSNLTANCSVDNTTYQVYFEITGGNPATYTVIDNIYGIGGTITPGNPTTYVSNPISNDAPYSFTVTDAFQCNNQTVSGSQHCPCDQPIATISGGGNLCPGSAPIPIRIDFTSGAGGSGIFDIQYSNGTNIYSINGISQNPYIFYVSTPGVYTLTYVKENCIGITNGTAIVTQHPKPQVTISGNNEICSGTSTNITFNMTGTPPWRVTYTDGTNIYVANFNTSPGIVSVSPTQTTTYTLMGIQDRWCSNSATGSVTIIVNPSPTAVLSNSGNQTICSGNSAILTINLTGIPPWNVFYNDGFSSNNLVINTTPYQFIVSPSISSTYTLTHVFDKNCTGTASGSAQINVIPRPTCAISGTTNICYGNNATLFFAMSGTPPWTVVYTDGTTNYTQVFNTTNATITVSPTTTTTYSLVSVQDANCQGTTSGTAVITVTPLPTATANPSSICLGGITTITASGGDSYLWSTGETTQQISVSPSTSTYYSVTVINSGCASTTSTLVTVHQPPIAIAGNDFSICRGNIGIIDGSGSLGNAPLTYTWNQGLGNGAQHVINPNITTTYILTVTDVNGCKDIDDIVVTVHPLPTAEAGQDKVICKGESTIIDASLSYGNGPLSYYWDNSVGSGPVHTVTPDITTLYHLTVTDANGCSNYDSVTIIVKPLPTIIHTPQNPSICEGSSINISLIGAATYLWSPTQGITPPWGDQVIAYPTNTTTYTITGTSLNGCSNTAEITVIVNNNPNVTIIPTSITACYNTSHSLTANGASSYIWSPSQYLSSTNSSTVTVTPTSSITYTVTGYDNNSCKNTATVTVFVPPFETPIILSDHNGYFCHEESIQATLWVNNQYDEYLWNTGATTPSIQINQTGIYTVTVTDQWGCQYEAQAYEVIQLPPFHPYIYKYEDFEICEGEELLLKLDTVYYTYYWSTGSVTPQIHVTESGLYYCFVWNKYGCSGYTDTVEVIVHPKPIASAGWGAHQLTVDFFNFSQNGTTYLWNFGDGTEAAGFEPIHTYQSPGTYTVTLTVFNDCGSDTYSFIVTVSNAVDGINENQFNSLLTVYPNPANDFININIHTKQPQNITVTLYDELGKKIWHEYKTNLMGNYNIKLPVFNFSDGYYYIYYSTTNETITKKILVTK